MNDMIDIMQIASSGAFMSPDIISNKFEHVWLYGSNPDNEKLWQHDGVAPQEEHEKIIDTDRRRFIEADGLPEHLNFLDAHSSSSYEFIFNNTIEKSAGYVFPR